MRHERVVRRRPTSDYPIRRADRSPFHDTSCLVVDLTAARLVFPIDLNALDRARRRYGEAEVRALQEVGILQVRCERCGRKGVITALRVGRSLPCYQTTA